MITSSFHMPRSRAIFEDCFALAGLTLHGLRGYYSLDFHSVRDEGVFPPEVLAARQHREHESLKVRIPVPEQLVTQSPLTKRSGPEVPFSGHAYSTCAPPLSTGLKSQRYRIVDRGVTIRRSYWLPKSYMCWVLAHLSCQTGRVPESGKRDICVVRRGGKMTPGEFAT